MADFEEMASKLSKLFTSPSMTQDQRASQDAQWAQIMPHSKIMGHYPSMSPNDALNIIGMTSSLGGYPKISMQNAPKIRDSSEYSGQLNDLVDNENNNPQMLVQRAREMINWAQSRAHDPGFLPYVYQAVTDAQDILRKFAAKSVDSP